MDTHERQLEEKTAKKARYFEKVWGKLQTLFTRKNIQYGDATDLTGVLGATVEIVGITARLQEMVIRSPDKGANNPEKLQDIFQDLINYAMIAHYHTDQKNWCGKEIGEQWDLEKS